MNKSEKLQILSQRVAQCQCCQELASTRTNTVFGVGNPNTRIILCGEAPGKDEDQQGEPFVGRAGQLLNNILSAAQIKREDIYILNILKCRPPNNRVPTDEESANCKPFLNLQLKIIEPRFIFCLGTTAAHNLLGESTPISQMRGQWYSYESIPVLCTFHPAYLLRNPHAKKDAWADWQLLLDRLKSEL